MADRPPHHEIADLHGYVVPITPKMLGETLSVAQTALQRMADERGRRGYDELEPHFERLAILRQEIDRMRPTGPDGSHGDRHTPVCGCPSTRH